MFVGVLLECLLECWRVGVFGEQCRKSFCVECLVFVVGVFGVLVGVLLECLLV